VAKSLRFYRELCLRSFYHFVLIVGGSVGQGGIICEQIHKPLCDFFQNDLIKRRAIFLPRNWLKSTVFTQWGAIWCYLRDNNTRTLIASQNQDKASEFFHFIQDQILHNKKLRQLFPELLVIDESYKNKHRWSAKHIELPRTRSYREPSIACIGVTGAAQGGHWDNIFIDDPVGEKHKDSIVELSKVLRWHDGTRALLDNPNFEHPEASSIQLICTHWGPADYGCYVQQEYPEFHWRITPALKDPELKDTDKIIYIQDPNAEVLTSNWEGAPKGRSTTKYYLDMMASPDPDINQIFWSQHQNNPQRSSGQTKLDYDWIRWYKWKEIDKELYVHCKDDGEEFRLADIYLIGMIDPGGFREMKVVKRSSRNAILIGGQPHNSMKKFVTYTWCGPLRTTGEFLDEVYRAYHEQYPRAFNMDTVMAHYIFQHVIDTIPDRAPGMRLAELPVATTKDSKDEDIMALIRPAANGEIYLHESFKELIGEWRNFPGGMTKDLLDMLGKLNRYYWNPYEPKKLMELARKKRKKIIEARNPMTGY